MHNSHRGSPGSRACFHGNHVLETDWFLRQRHGDSHLLKDEIKIELKNKPITVTSILAFLQTHTEKTFSLQIISLKSWA